MDPAGHDNLSLTNIVRDFMHLDSCLRSGKHQIKINALNDRLRILLVFNGS